MTTGDKNHLLKLLTESHSAARATIEGIDPEWRVYTDTGWRIRDIIGHIATWDRQVAKSLQAFRTGKEYSIPGNLFLNSKASPFPIVNEPSFFIKELAVTKVTSATEFQISSFTMYIIKSFHFRGFLYFNKSLS